MSDIVKNQLKFANGHALEVLKIDDKDTQYIQGQKRSVIDTRFDPAAYAQFKSEVDTPGNLDALTILMDITHDDETVTHYEWLHTNFNIVQRLAEHEAVEITPATDTTPPVVGEVGSLVLAQLTYLEVTEKSQQGYIDMLLLTNLGV